MMGCKLAVHVVHPAENMLKKFSPKRKRAKSFEDIPIIEDCPDSDVFPFELKSPDAIS